MCRVGGCASEALTCCTDGCTVALASIGCTGSCTEAALIDRAGSYVSAESMCYMLGMSSIGCIGNCAAVASTCRNVRGYRVIVSSIHSRKHRQS